MKLKAVCPVICLALAGAAAHAQVQTDFYTATFAYDATNELLPLGFGRAGDQVVDRVVDPLAALGGGRTAAAVQFVPAADAATIGVLPFSFHDFWSFNGLEPGTYTFDTTINAVGDAGFGAVTFEWYTAGAPHAINFQISADFKTAHGSGSFTVDPGCDVNHCVFMNFFGWDDGTSASGYNALAGVAVVPEPDTNLMLLAGLGCLAWLARRRQTPA